MYIAMNRFNVLLEQADAFETVWRTRDSSLGEVPGFVAFRLLRGPEGDDTVLYASHTQWQDRAAFEAWTRSEAFRRAHRDAGRNKPMYAGHPEFEGFETVLESE